MFKINEEIINFCKKMQSLHIKRWEELPSFELYANQVVDIVKDELFFLGEFDEDFITKSMINNYVKKKVVPKPVNKKYNTEALAKLITISLLKQLLEISDINKGIILQTEILGKEKAYDKLIDEFERASNLVFGEITKSTWPMDINIEKIEPDSVNLTLSAFAIANKLLINKLLNADGFLIKK